MNLDLEIPFDIENKIYSGKIGKFSYLDVLRKGADRPKFTDLALIPPI